MDPTWTLAELVAEVATRLAALPAPTNGQVRAVPDERTIRYYGSIGLLDRPTAMRGRTALYDRRHLAQVVAIKRMQTAGHSLADIQRLWPTLDDSTLARMSGVTPHPGRGRKDFWKREAAMEPIPPPTTRPAAAPSTPVIGVVRPIVNAPSTPIEVRVEVAHGIQIAIALPELAPVTLSPADVRAFRAAAAPLVTELAKRGLIARPAGTLEEP
jgi:DNA-binding transcriptional MerR regulator